MSLTVQPELTPRQQQILKLLQAGKVNKEVARELDIGLGTVKQHIVAIFKKLKVRNRTAAVSRHLDLQPQAEAKPAPLLGGTLLTRRPCVVLSMALPKTTSPALVSSFYSAMATAAAAHNAIFLTRQGYAGEVIFGIEQVTEYDVAAALQTAHRVADPLFKMQPGMQRHIRGCLSAGLALASMHRLGGWTGEAIASAAISSARELLDATPEGLFTCDPTILDLCSAFGVSGFAGLSNGVTFEMLANMQWHGMRRSFPLVGREFEMTKLLEALNHAFDNHSSVVFIEGEMGMGKTRLCQELLLACQSKGGQQLHFRGLPALLGSGVCDVSQGTQGDVANVLHALNNLSPSSARLVVLDDFHLIEPAQQSALINAAALAKHPGRLVVFAGRKGLCQMTPNASPCLQLRRLPQREMQELVRHTLAMPRGQQRAAVTQKIVDTALGVPLFAVEMAHSPHDSELPLSLRVAVLARIDKLHLDSTLLTFVARHPGKLSVAELAQGLNDDAQAVQRQVERAVASGVLALSNDDKLSFTHPMIRRAIDNSAMNPSGHYSHPSE
jgi:DNA-binding CsgD family transcriptional regulator